MLRRFDPSKFDLILTFESPTLTRNSIGENETTWAVLKSASAERKWKPGSEQFELKQQFASDVIQFTMRYDSAITSLLRFRVNQDTSYFYIKNVQQNQREGFNLIIAENRDNQ